MMLSCTTLGTTFSVVLRYRRIQYDIATDVIFPNVDDFQMPAILYCDCAVFCGVLENILFENDVMMMVVTKVIVRCMLMIM